MQTNHLVNDYIDQFIRMNILDLRLINSDGNVNTANGRVEIYQNGEWGTVCNDGFGSTEATVVCRQLGHMYDLPLLFHLVYDMGS